MLGKEGERCREEGCGDEEMLNESPGLVERGLDWESGSVQAVTN